MGPAVDVIADTVQVHRPDDHPALQQGLRQRAAGPAVVRRLGTSGGEGDRLPLGLVGQLPQPQPGGFEAEEALRSPLVRMLRVGVAIAGEQIVDDRLRLHDVPLGPHHLGLPAGQQGVERHLGADRLQVGRALPGGGDQGEVGQAVQDGPDLVARTP